jgi:hypothetical protein
MQKTDYPSDLVCRDLGGDPQAGHGIPVVMEPRMKELDSVVLTIDLPEHRLKRGDLGTVVLVHQGDKGYGVEFVALDGESVVVVSLLASQVRSIGRREIAHVRRMPGGHQSQPAGL